MHLQKYWISDALTVRGNKGRITYIVLRYIVTCLHSLNAIQGPYLIPRSAIQIIR